MRVPFSRFVVMAGAIIALCSAAFCAIKMPAIFSNGMVLQRDQRIPVWGTADAGERITVTLAGKSASAVAKKDGTWKVALPALPAGGPFEMVVTGSSTLKISDVLIGEVWLCSGQSNMVAGFRDNSPSADPPDPLLRQIEIKKTSSLTPLTDCEGTWTSADVKKRSFCAVGYFFARELRNELNVPVGIIQSAYGGTYAEAWTSKEGLARPVIGQQAWNDFLKLEADEKNAAPIASPAYDDTKWKTMTLPGNWEKQGLPDFNGMVWFRKTIDLPAAWAGKDLTLALGPVDEIDITWFNGVKVGAMGWLGRGETQYWFTPRTYTIPGALVKAGKNLIAVRVIDTAGEGGFWFKEPYTMQIALAGTKDAEPIRVDGEWRYGAERSLDSPPGLFMGLGTPSVLYNSMINPLVPYGIRGVVWYQGETNGPAGRDYGRVLKALILDWRKKWGGKPFPFITVQLPNYSPGVNGGKDMWAALREGQAKSLKLPNTGLAVSVDCGDAVNIHPNNKPIVGHRVALVGLAQVYGKKIEYSGPMYWHMAVEGKSIRLWFTHVGQGLEAKGGDLGQFVIAGKDQKFYPAKAVIDGDTVVVSSDQVTKPVAVRYAWADNPVCTFYNKDGLPAVPFRTDGWENY